MLIFNNEERRNNLLILRVHCFSLQTKVKHIKETAKILKEQFNGDIPNTVEALRKLPGVGPKMAHVCMQVAWGITSGIGIKFCVIKLLSNTNIVIK